MVGLLAWNIGRLRPRAEFSIRRCCHRAQPLATSTPERIDFLCFKHGHDRTDRNPLVVLSANLGSRIAGVMQCRKLQALVEDA